MNYEKIKKNEKTLNVLSIEKSCKIIVEIKENIVKGII